MGKDTPDIARKLRQEHASLGAELSELRALLDRPSGPESRARWLEALDQLVATLSRHFEFEEQGGYMSEVVARFPNWAADVEQLRREHREMLSSIKAIRTAVGQLPESGKPEAELRRQIEEWLAGISAHERHENLLLQEAFNLDMGTAD